MTPSCSSPGHEGGKKLGEVVVPAELDEDWVDFVPELDDDFGLELEPFVLEPEVLALPLELPVLFVEDGVEVDGVEVPGVDDEGVEVAGVDFAAAEPAAAPLTVTWTFCGVGELEPASPIRTPTPSASSSTAIPASRVLLDDQPERRGGVAVGSTRVSVWRVNRG
jgi:hypothetical protein